MIETKKEIEKDCEIAKEYGTRMFRGVSNNLLHNSRKFIGILWRAALVIKVATFKPSDPL